MIKWKKVSVISSVVIAASAMGACSTTGNVKTSAANPAPISFKVGAPTEASRQMASLSPAAPRSYVASPQPAARPAPEYLAPLPQAVAQPAPQVSAPALPQAIVPAAPTPEHFDPSGVDTQLYMHQKVGRPYKIKGVQYKPEHNPSYDETGIASWYGPNFHGKLTANGETYDKNGLTAAHKTLPLNSMVFVTNLETGKTATLRLNDRGPFVEGRIIDLSYGAAKLLGVTGLSKVRVQYAGPADPMNNAPVNAEPVPVETEPFVAQLPSAPTIETPAVPVIEAPAPQSVALTPHAPQGYQPLSVVPHGGAPAIKTPAPQVTAPAPAPKYVAPNAPYQPKATGKARPRQTFNPPVNGGVMTMTITGPIHMASTGGAKPVNSAPIAQTGQYVQAAAFSSESRARSVSQTLSAAGPVSLTQISRNGKILHRVIVGPYDSAASADNALALVAKLGYSDARIVRLD